MKHCSPISSKPSGNFSSQTKRVYKKVFTPVILLSVDGNDSVPLSVGIFSKAPFSMSVTPSGMLSDPESPLAWKAEPLIFFSTSGNTMLVRSRLYSKHWVGISSSSHIILDFQLPAFILTSFRLRAVSANMLSRMMWKS